MEYNKWKNKKYTLSEAFIIEIDDKEQTRSGLVEYFFLRLHLKEVE
jgi:hypothetical protein